MDKDCLQHHHIAKNYKVAIFIIIIIDMTIIISIISIMITNPY